MQPPESTLPLVAACAAFVDELRRYEEVVLALSGLVLDSEPALVRAELLAKDAAACEARLSGHLSRLAAALAGTRELQQSCFERRVAATEAAGARREDRRELLDRFQRLGEHAERVNEPLAALVASAAASDRGALSKVLHTTSEEMAVLIREGEALAEAARARGWSDLCQQAEAIQQQTQAAREQVLGAARKLAASAPS